MKINQKLSVILDDFVHCVGSYCYKYTEVRQEYINKIKKIIEGEKNDKKRRSSKTN